MRHFTLWLLLMAGLLLALAPFDFEATNVNASTQTQKQARRKTSVPPVDELAKLREQYVNATKEYKASLEKLLAIYENNVKKAEDKVALSKKLFTEGLIAKQQVEENEHALEIEKEKVAETQRQMTSADSQIADILVEAQADVQMAKNLRAARNGLVRTTSFTRYNGSALWGLADAWKIQRFFSDTFHKPLPVAVFGQGSVHDRWRLDHHNAMDISLHPDGVEGQALLKFLQQNGIPYSAFRVAIPGTATGPHIHIGRPSHRY
jgi:hypothetical protein